VPQLRDHDFHPDEPDVRIFDVPPSGVLRRDDHAIVTATRCGDLVLRHYAFADRWYKINVTTTLSGEIVEGGADGFAFNCDLATPMIADGSDVYAVDLFLDVLVRADGTTYWVVDDEALTDAVSTGLVSTREAASARSATADLTTIIRGGRLLNLLDAVAPFGPSPAPQHQPMRRAPLPPRLRPCQRPTW
jgi:hypothetical protein